MNVNSPGVRIIQDVDKAIRVMHDAGTWLQKSGKHPSKWWRPQNMNREFLLRHAEPNEFFVALVGEVPAASAILQNTERNQSWQSVDKNTPQSALYIHWLCVAREFAGKNLPKIMIDFSSQEAKKRGLRLLRLDTNADEVKLRKIYENLGFQLAGEEQKGSHKTAFYQKSL